MNYTPYRREKPIRYLRKRRRQGSNEPSDQKNITSNWKKGMSVRSVSFSLLLFSLVLQQAVLPVYGEDGMAYDDQDDYFDNSNGQGDDEFYYAVEVTSSPTLSPTQYFTHEPTWAGDDFYEIDTDDGYTAEAQSARIYYSSISDVILCLMCTFFWVLWLVGTIFPTKIQHLYKTEGIVVKGYVVESYTSSNVNAGAMQLMQMEIDMYDDDEHINEEAGINFADLQIGMEKNTTGKAFNNNLSKDSSKSAPNPLAGNMMKDKEVTGPVAKNSSSGDYDLDIAMGADTDDELDVPVYHAIVSYVVPGRIAAGVRKRLHKAPPLAPLSPVAEDYVLHSEESVGKGNSNRPNQPIETDFTRNKSAGNNVKMPPRSPHRLGKNVFPTSYAAMDGMSNVVNDYQAHHGGNGMSDEFDSTAALSPRFSTNRGQSLLDIHTSFDTVNSIWKDNDKGYYKYNQKDDSDYDTPLGEDEYEDDPEYIGNIFYQFGLIRNPKRKIKPIEPVRVKKRFETNQLLDPGRDNVEILVLPGNPGSGLLKTDFEQEEYQLNNGASKDDDTFAGSRMGDFSTGVIGIVLASVSVIGAVHGVLTLPYIERGCKYTLEP